ncbi:MAG: ferritin family protein [Deltaproteobacteria bacterium]|nr:ferritin family protein [Deltaproteobacteria bacterium]
MGKNENLIRIFEYALSQEKTGKSFFEESLKRLGTGTARSAFRRLIEEEEKHIDMLNRILQGLHRGPEFEAGALGRIKMEKTRFFDRKEKAGFLKECMRDSTLPDACIFNTAYLIEKDISEFYGAMAEKTTGDVKKAFLLLARWEEEHARFFKEFKDKLSAVYLKL